MNYYEHHLGDYLRDTAHLSMLEDGAYRRLLDAYYIREQPLPSELREVYRLVRAASKQDREAVDVVLREFFQQTAGGWTHKRCTEEIARFQDKQAKARRSAEARWNAKRSECERNANACADDMRTHCEGNAPRARPQTPDTSTPSLRSGVGRASRLPEDWEPDGDSWNWAVAELGSGERMGRELATFRDYWKAKPGKDGTKLDWDATWRNWVRRAADSGKGRGNSAPSRESAVDRVRRANAAALEDGGEVLAAHDGDLRPQVDVDGRRNADGIVVDGSYRLVG